MSSKLGGRIFMWLLSLGFIGFIGGLIAVASILFYLGKDLPDYKTLVNYKPPIVTRAYASDGRLLAEFAAEKRVYIPINSVPRKIIDAFLSAEDKNFYSHYGVDFKGILRSIIINIKNFRSHKRPVGASTITQQVARNFFLSNEVSYVRKLKEMLIAFRLEQVLTKNQILEIYLNEIYLGKRVFGIAAASLEYFNRSLSDLSLGEIAYLAALPKGPNNYNPDKHYDAAITRRNWVLDQMFKNKKITKDEAEDAKARPLILVKRDNSQYVKYPYFAEEIRRKLKKLYGENGLYQGGLIAHTTLIPSYQRIAEKALRNALIAYDKRHGLHSKAIATISNIDNWHENLSKIKKPKGTQDFKLAVVLKSSKLRAIVGFKDGEKGIITFNKIKWTKEYNRVDSLLKAGDVWLTQPSGEFSQGYAVYWLRQIPEVQGAIIAMDPHTGRIFAMAGGFSYALSQFNRASQAMRQPGSAFKPFVYLTAMENGFTPATLVMDAPFVFDQGPGLEKWRPKNYNDDFLGPTPLRIGLEKSRNLMTIRLASYIGMDKIAETAKRFGIIDNMPKLLSMSVGAGETTLLKMVTAYSSLVNGGKKVIPTMLDRVQDRDGKTIYIHSKTECKDCGPLIAWTNQATPEIADNRKQIADPRYVYQIVSMLEGAVKRGTGIAMRSLNRPIAGKTGTTNNSKDAWFIGFTPDIVVGAYVGFDEPKTLGSRETGSRVALPIVKEFMSEALKNVSPVPFRVPKGIRLVRINAKNGTRAKVGDENVILEAFVAGTEPTDEPTMFTGDGISPVSDFSNTGESIETGLGGLY